MHDRQMVSIFHGKDRSDNDVGLDQNPIGSGPEWLPPY